MALSLGTAVLGSIFLTPLLAALGTVPGDGALFEATRDYLRILVLATPLFYLCNVLNYFLHPSFFALVSGLGTSVQYLYQMIIFLLCNNVLIRLGGETGVAVFDVIQNSSYLILCLYEGTARAMQPVLTTCHGEHNLDGLRRTSALGFGSGVAVGSLLIALIAVWPRSMCLLFGIAGSAAEPMAAFALRVYVLGAFFAGLNILLCNYYQSFGISRAAFVLETLRGGVLLLPLTVICAQYGLYGFWWLSQGAADERQGRCGPLCGRGTPV